MKEHEIIACTVLYLIKEKKAEIEEISARTKQNHGTIKGKLLEKGISKKIVDGIKFKCRGEDIIAYLKSSRTGQKEKRLGVKAKGDSSYSDKRHKLYTSLGQFICLKKSTSEYQQFIFALPYSWRDKVREMLRDSEGNEKPIIKDIMNAYTGLYFYFVKDNGKVIPETWSKTLK
ncbi:hypothetical protein KAW50_05900 [candidate division WOR-3 bacterium]|nr:hypothetical protein [candidate division WOR-3 bacterium]